MNSKFIDRLTTPQTRNTLFAGLGLAFSGLWLALEEPATFNEPSPVTITDLATGIDYVRPSHGDVIGSALMVSGLVLTASSVSTAERLSQGAKEQSGE